MILPRLGFPLTPRTCARAQFGSVYWTWKMHAWRDTDPAVKRGYVLDTYQHQHHHRCPPSRKRKKKKNKVAMIFKSV